MNCYGEKPAEFRRLQPSGQIPVAIIDGRVYGQSNDILQALEQLFPEHKSLQPPKGQEARANQLLRLERAIFSAWLGWLTGSANYKRNFLATLDEVERELSSVGPFFCGKDVTMVDFMFASFLERLVRLWMPSPRRQFLLTFFFILQNGSVSSLLQRISNARGTGSTDRLPES